MSLGGLFYFPVLAAEQGKIEIKSQTMITLGKSRKVLFKGGVVLTRGSIVIRSDQMIVIFKKENNNQPERSSNDSFNQQIDLVEAKGNVRIKKANGRAKCGRAIFYKDEEKIVLTESPVAWQGGARISGPRMTMHLKDNKSFVEGGSHVLIMEKENGE